MLSYVILCKDKRTRQYFLATPQTYATKEDADTYASTLKATMDPIVVPGHWFELWEPTGHWVIVGPHTKQDMGCCRTEGKAMAEHEDPGATFRLVPKGETCPICQSIAT